MLLVIQVIQAASVQQVVKCQKREVGREVFGGDKEGREGKKISLGCATRVKQVRGFGEGGW